MALSVSGGVEHLLPFPSGEFGAAYVLLAALLGVCAVGAARLPRAAAVDVTGRVGVRQFQPIDHKFVRMS